jgi:hypothetical protein
LCSRWRDLSVGKYNSAKDNEQFGQFRKIKQSKAIHIRHAEEITKCPFLAVSVKEYQCLIINSSGVERVAVLKPVV